MKRIIITGITGYIGSHLAQSLLPEYEVYGLVREPLNQTYIEDISSQIHFVYYDGSYDSMKTALETSRPDLVYHLAAYYTGARGEEHVSKLVDANITLGAYLLEAMAACGVPALVYASTIMAHYQGEAYRPLNLYAATKQAFSDLLAYYTDTGLLRAVTLVLSDTCGPDDHRPKVLNLIRDVLQKGETIALSDGGQDYDVVLIDDVVRAFRMAGERLLQRQDWTSEVFQVCAPAPLTLRQTVEQIFEGENVMRHLLWGQRPAPGREIRKAIRLYPTLPNWTPLISLEEGFQHQKRLMPD